MSALRLLLVLGLWMGLMAPARAAALTVAAASSVQEPLTELARAFERATGQQVRPVFGASGKFVAQIAQGAPFDLFFSADTSYPDRLESQGLSGSPRLYARGRLVLWAPRGSVFDVQLGMDVLRDRRLGHLAVANPRLAPYGRAAVEAMHSAQVAEAVATKLVLGENVAQTLQFALSGGADLAFVPLSLAVSPKIRGTYWLVPEGLHAPLDAEAVVLKSSRQPALAERFLSYCTGPSAVPVWRRYGMAVE